MKTFGAIVLVYRQIDYIDYCLTAAAEQFDRIVCMYTDAPFVAYNPDSRRRFGGDDGSREVLHQHEQENPRVHVIEGRWHSEERMRTEALTLLKDWDIDYTYILDADEIYPDGVLDQIKSWTTSHSGHSRFQVRYRNLFKRMDHEVVAPDLWQNACYVTRDISAFERGRTIEMPAVRLPAELFFWHFGWVLSDERMREKVSTYSHSHELAEDWFRDKWLSWTPRTTDLCARGKWRWDRTAYVDPEELPAVVRSHPLRPVKSRG